MQMIAIMKGGVILGQFTADQQTVLEVEKTANMSADQIRQLGEKILKRFDPSTTVLGEIDGYEWRIHSIPLWGSPVNTAEHTE